MASDGDASDGSDDVVYDSARTIYTRTTVIGTTARPAVSQQNGR